MNKLQAKKSIIDYFKSNSIEYKLGGPGVIIMLTSDRKEYVIGREGFESDWLHPEHTFPFMVEAFSEKSDKWFRISKKYVSEKIYCLKEFQSQVNNVIENYRKKDGLLYNWEYMLDCGCGLQNGRLASICLENGERFYA